MAIAALMVAILSVLATAASIIYARRSAGAAQASALAAQTSATAALAQAAAAEDQALAAKAQVVAAEAQAQAAIRQLKIDQERLHRERTPVLDGAVTERHLSRGVTDHKLEIRLRSGPSLASITLRLNASSGISRATWGLGMGHDLHYPESAGSRVTISQEHPASWVVAVADDAPDTVMLTASCRDEAGAVWDGVDVPVRVRGTVPGR
jgi:hypothetical protein